MNPFQTINGQNNGPKVSNCKKKLLRIEIILRIIAYSLVVYGGCFEIADAFWQNVQFKSKFKMVLQSKVSSMSFYPDSIHILSVVRVIGH